MLNILVCVKQVPDVNLVKIDPETGSLIRKGVPAILNPHDENALEAALLTGENYPGQSARALLGLGMKRVFVSLGAGGMLAAEGNEVLRLPCMTGRIVNTTGAGDAAVAAIVWAGVQGFDLRKTTEAALSAGAQTCAVEETNNPDLKLSI